MDKPQARGRAARGKRRLLSPLVPPLETPSSTPRTPPPRSWLLLPHAARWADHVTRFLSDVGWFLLPV